MTYFNNSFPGIIIIDSGLYQKGSLELFLDEVAQTVRVMRPYQPYTPVINATNWQDIRYIMDDNSINEFDDWAGCKAWVYSNFFFDAVATGGGGGTGDVVNGGNVVAAAMKTGTIGNYPYLLIANNKQVVAAKPGGQVEITNGAGGAINPTTGVFEQLFNADVDSTLSVMRMLDRSTNSNGHGINSADIWTKIIDGLAYAAVTTNTYYGLPGDTGHYNHFANFQAAGAILVENRVDYVYGYINVGKMFGAGPGRITYNYGFYNHELQGLTNTIDNNYGFYCQRLTNGTKNWSYYAEGSEAFFGEGARISGGHALGDEIPLTHGFNGDTQTYSRQYHLINVNGSGFFYAEVGFYLASGTIAAPTYKPFAMSGDLGGMVINYGKTILKTVPVYANDAAADADALLDHGGVYQLTGSGRQLFRKP